MRKFYSKLTLASDIKPTQFICKGMAPLGRYLQGLMVSSQELVIEKRRDRNGYCYWRVYAPMTQDIRIYHSENEVRVWLEQRHHQ